MRRRIKKGAAALVGAAAMGAVLLLAAGPASAHVEEHVGPYHMEVGFLDEPAIAGFQNGVFFEVTQASNDAPVDVGESLKVSVGFGDQTMDLSFEPIPDNPGQYVAAFIPTQPGAYTFAFSGTIKGTPLDLSLTSGPETFNEVQNPSDLQFPVKVPSVTDVATKLDRETARVTSAAEAARSEATAAKETVQTAKDDASTAMTFGIVGIVVGVLGLILAIVALLVARRRTAAAPAPAPTTVG
jgi:hypothetical protein